MKKNILSVMVLTLTFIMLVSLVSFAADPLALEENKLEGKDIGVIQLTMGTTYHAAMSDRFKELADIYGVNLRHTCSANRSSQEQLKLAEDLIANGVEVLILNPVGDEIVPSIARLCENKGVEMFCVDNTSPGEGYVYVGINNFDIARAIGRYLGSKSSGNENIVYVRSVPTDTGCPAYRFGGIMGGLSDEGEVFGYTLLDERWADGDVGESQGMLQMEELLAANDDIDIVIAHHDAQALGALTAIKNAGRMDDIEFIAGFDGEKRMLEEIKAAKGGKNGPDLVTGLNSPTMIAELTFETINDQFMGKTVRDSYYIPVVAISHKNVDEYMDKGF